MFRHEGIEGNYFLKPTKEEAMSKIPQETGNYERYKSLGGIINQQDCESALQRLQSAPAPSASVILQAEGIAKTAGILLHSTKGTVDERVALYGVLRNDNKPADVEYHHGQMSDQEIFVEALRMLGDADSLKKMILAFPNISFHYESA